MHMPGCDNEPSLSESQIDLSFLFNQCRAPKMGLSEDDYAAAAKELDVDVASIKAVALVESAGKPFDLNGRPVILFERHYFHRLTGGRFDAKHPGISAKKPGGYNEPSYDKLEEAYGLDPDAALESASWGRFQIMGSNYKSAGFTSVRAFVLAMSTSEVQHLNAFVAFIKSDKTMAKALRDHDWAGFAKCYNGKNYSINKYDEKLQKKFDELTKAAPATKAAAKKAPAAPSVSLGPKG
jgi:N-acetylmuramidase